jgi:hypothetical protein
MEGNLARNPLRLSRGSCLLIRVNLGIANKQGTLDGQIVSKDCSP